MTDNLSPPEVIFSNESLFCNRHGSLRLCRVRDYFGLSHDVIGNYVDGKGMMHDVKVWVQKKPLTKYDLDEIVNVYTAWRDFDEVVPVKYVYRSESVFYMGDKSNNFMGFMYDKFNVSCKEYGGFVWVPGERNEWRLFDAPKRGNAQYINMVDARLNPLLEQKPLTFFNPDWGTKRTNMLYVTGTTEFLTDDGSRVLPISKAWLSFGERWNKYITNLSRQFKGVSYIRTWQSQKNGYPHFHAVIYFRNFEFSVVPWVDGNGLLTWRVHSRQKLKKGDKMTVRQRLKSAWKWGNLDVVCVQNTDDVFKDLLKYVTRDLEGGESDLTNAMVWYFGKQAYSISKSFVKDVWGVDVSIAPGDPGNADLIDPDMYNSNSKLLRIEVYPTLPADLVRKKSYQVLLFDEEDPPPRSIDVPALEHVTCDCECRLSKGLTGSVPVYVWKWR